MRVALYARVSTKDKGQDTETQLVQLRAFCGQQGWNIHHEYVDRMSGKYGLKRPQFNALMEAASRCEFDLVLFWSLDRFSREGVLETLQHLQRLNGWGVNWRSHQESWLDSMGPFRDVVLALLATIAKQERVRLSERVHAGLEKAKRAGRHGGRPRVIVDREQVRKLRAQGLSLRAIGDELGVATMTVHNILKAS